MTIEIPMWLIWTLGLLVGVPPIAVVLVLAWFGYVALTAYGRNRT